MSKKLTIRQALFVDYYCELLNGMEAARSAGYKGDNNTLAVTAHNNLKKPHIAEAIKARVSAMAMTTGEALGRLGEMARADIGEFIFKDPTTDELKLDWEKARGKTHLIKTIRHSQSGLILELHDPQAAIDKILKVGGAYSQNDKPLDVVVFDIEQWKKERAERLRKAAERDSSEE